jgi:hypothetical protein
MSFEVVYDMFEAHYCLPFVVSAATADWVNVRVMSKYKVI